MEVSEVFVTFSKEIDVGVLVVMGYVNLLGVYVFVKMVLLIVVTGVFADFSVEIEDGVFVVMDRVDLLALSEDIEIGLLFVMEGIILLELLVGI